MSFSVADLNDEIQLQRKLVLTPCASKDGLRTWMRRYLKFDCPDVRIDNDSTGSPLDTIWDIYNAGVTCNHESPSRFLWFASRDSFKTLGASCLELLALLHMKRSVVHMAAIEAQSDKAAEYYKRFLDFDEISEFKVGDNKRTVAVCWFEHNATGNILTLKEWKDMGGRTRIGEYKRYVHYIKILVNTPQSANSDHVAFMCVDGNSELLVSGGVGNRKRIRRTARGVFKRLAGLPPTGRPGGESELDVPVVQKQIDALSLNLGTGELEYKRIVRAHRAWRKTIRLVCADGRLLVCTLDHPVYVLGRGMVQAGQVIAGDRLVVLHKGQTQTAPRWSAADNSESFHGTVSQDDPWEQVVLGSLLGDCGIYVRSWMTNPYLSEQHCVEQGEYLAWKRSVVSNKLKTYDKKNCYSGYTGRQQVGFNSSCSPLLRPFLRIRDNFEGIERLGPLGLAVWYMDDGCAGNGFRLSTECWSKEQNEFLAGFLTGHFGIEATARSYVRDTENGPKEYWYLDGDVAAKRRLVEICKKYVHPSMAYKFDVVDNQGVCRFCGGSYWYCDTGSASETCDGPICRRLAQGSLVFSEVVSFDDAGERWVYDFTVEGNHNFWSNGILSKNCVDEVDLIRYPKAYREALFIPTTMKDEDGLEQPPITLLTSSRKYAGGLVQDEIDSAEERGTAIRHHNILDVTARCPDERHRPDKPKLQIYRSNDTLKTISPDEFKTLQTADPKKAESYVQDEAYWGCVNSCKIFSGCRGRLACQTSNSTALKPTYDTIRKWKEVGDVEMVKAQLLCWKPGNSGAVYANFSRVANMLTLDKMWEEVTGSPPPAPVSKVGLIEMFMKRGYPVSGGMDFGFTHCFAVVVGFVVGRRLYIIDAFEIPELEPHQCVEVCDRRIKYLAPLLWPDTAYPAYIKMFRSAGYRCREHKKDVVGGIESVRKKIAPAGLDPELYLIKGDDGCELMAKRMESYRWKEDSVGRITDVPLDVDDDLDDALRYLVQNTFDRGSGIILAKGVASNIPTDMKTSGAIFPTPNQQMSAKIHELTGGEAGSTIGMPAMMVLEKGQEIGVNKKKFKRGGFYADFG